MLSSGLRSHVLLICGFLPLTACSAGQPTVTGVTDMRLGGAHSCATVVDNGMRCWGNNVHGQLGNGGNQGSATPVEPTGWSGGATILDFAAGDSHTCVNGSGGKLSCWGENVYGQLGLDNTTNFNLSQPVREIIAGGSAHKASFVVAGADHACALYSSGAVACWGRFYDKKPQGILGFSNPLRIAAGGNQTCVGEAGGTVKCWRMRYGSQPNPTVVPGVAAKRIAVGRAHACAINQADAVQCWGSNTWGQLGNGNRWPTKAVVTVARSGPFVAAVEIAAGLNHTCALLSSGAVECWGSNSDAQTGDPNSIQYTLTPYPVIAAGATGVAAGVSHSCARIRDGNVWRMRCWGANGSGQLGNPSAGTRSVTPVLVTGLP